MHRVVLDTNVLVSAVLDPDSVPGKVTRAAFEQRLELVVCPQLLEELAEVLARPKLSALVSSAEAAAFVEAIAGVGLTVPDPVDVPAIARDRNDDFLLALGLVAGVEWIVTGDHDLLDLKESPVPVCSPRALIDALGDR